MEYFAGLDVSIDETSVCVVTDKGDVILEISVATDPAEIADVLQHYAGRLRRVGHEAGSLSPWLHAELLALGLPVICLETRHVRNAQPVGGTCAASRAGAKRSSHPHWRAQHRDS